MSVGQHLQGLQAEEVVLQHDSLARQRGYFDRGHPWLLRLLLPEQIVDSEGLLLGLLLRGGCWGCRGLWDGDVGGVVRGQCQGGRRRVVGNGGERKEG